MRLLHLIQRYYPFEGGSERYFRAFSERFAADGAEVDVVTTDAWDLEYFWDPRRRRVEAGPETYHGVRIHRVPVRHLPAARLSHRAIRRLMAESSRISFSGQTRLLSMAGHFGPWAPALEATASRIGGGADLINVASIAFESMAQVAERTARRVGAAFVVTPFLHLGEGPGSKVRRYYTMPHQLALLRRADAVLALTAIEAEYLTIQGVPTSRIHIVGAGIDVAGVTGGDGEMARRRLGLDGPVVLAIGAAAFDKGTIHLVRAVERLNRTGNEVNLVVAGPVMSEFQRFIDELSPEARRNVKVLGFVSEEEKRDLLALADVVALPSRTESFGLVFLEAWANGKPVIGARAGAIPAVVEDGVDGLLAPFGDVPALAGALGSLIESPALSARMAAAGACKVVSEETWYSGIRDVYRQVLGTAPVVQAVADQQLVAGRRGA